jgi:hypothetical protein
MEYEMELGDVRVEKRQLGYAIKGKPYSLKTLGNFIREGHSIHVEDGDKVDYTGETLAAIALTDKGDFKLHDLLALILDKVSLYEIIEAGGMESFIIKRKLNSKKERKI